MFYSFFLSFFFFFFFISFAYGFLNAASMIACALAPFLYTGLLAIFSKTAVWIILASCFILLIGADAIYFWIIKPRRKTLKPKTPQTVPTVFGPNDVIFFFQILILFYFILFIYFSIKP